MDMLHACTCDLCGCVRVCVRLVVHLDIVCVCKCEYHPFILMRATAGGFENG